MKNMTLEIILLWTHSLRGLRIQPAPALSLSGITQIYTYLCSEPIPSPPCASHESRARMIFRDIFLISAIFFKFRTPPPPSSRLVLASLLGG